MLAIYDHIRSVVHSALWPSQGWRHRTEVAGATLLYMHVEKSDLELRNYVSVEVEGSELVMFNVANDYISEHITRIDLSDPESIALAEAIVYKWARKLK